MDKRIVGLYKDYNNVIKPLIAEVEARTEQFPLHAIKLVRKAKTEEPLDSVKALDTYQLSYNAYTEIETLIDSVYTDVHWARVRFSVRRGINILLWLLSAVLSGIISILLSRSF